MNPIVTSTETPTSPLASVQPQALKTENELRAVSGDLFRLHGFLDRLLGGQKGIDMAIQLLRNDRFLGTTTLTEFVENRFGQLPVVTGNMIQNDPLYAMLILILRDIPSEDHLRDAATEAYIAQYSEDKRFEKCYAYLKSPQILLTHLLILSNVWKCGDPSQTEFYDEQLAGSFQGTIAFYKGDRITREEYALIQKQEGENPRFPMKNKLVEKEGDFEVTGWCSTPAMVSRTLDDLFIASRRTVQEQVLSEISKDLKSTSPKIQEKYELIDGKSVAIVVIGPYGAGKTTFIRDKFGKDVTIYSVDMLNERLKGPTSRRQDHHFEAMMLKSKFFKEAGGIAAILHEVAAIDEFRFKNLVGRDFASRDQIIIEEIATENPELAVSDYITRDGVTDATALGAAKTSAADALKFRASRIDYAKQNPKITYTLYCRAINFGIVAQVKNGAVAIMEGTEDLFKKLTK